MNYHFESGDYFGGLDFNSLEKTAKYIQFPIVSIEEEEIITFTEFLKIHAGTPLKDKPMEEETPLGSTDDSDSPAEDVRDVYLRTENKAESKIAKKKITKAEKPKKAAKTPAKKRPQNLLKNAAGTFTAKLKKLTEEEAALYLYVCAYLGLTEAQKAEYKANLLSYNKNDKTWNKIDKFVGKKNGFGVFLTEMAIALLSDEKEYAAFVENSQLIDGSQTVYLEQENKDLWIFKFKAMRKKYQGDSSIFKADMRATKKSLKLKKNDSLISKEDSVVTQSNANPKWDSIDSFFEDFNEIKEGKNFFNNELNFNFNSNFCFGSFEEY